MNETRQNPSGLTKDSGWQVGLRKTIPYPHTRVWDLLVSEEGINTWLGIGKPIEMKKGVKYLLQNGTRGEIRVIMPLSHFRITRHPVDVSYTRASTIQVRVLEKDERTILVFHEEHLPNQKEREKRWTYFHRVMEKITELLQDSK